MARLLLWVCEAGGGAGEVEEGGGMALNYGAKLAVFAVSTRRNGYQVWTRAGTAYVNKDDSMNVFLDVLPAEGRLHCRVSVVEQDVVVVANNNEAQAPETDLATMEVGGNS